MKKISKIFILITVIATFSVYAKSIPVRSGVAVNAEFSSKKPEIKDFNELLFGTENAKSYAVVALRLSEGRSISIFDYQLIVDDKYYKCVALQKNYDGFKYTTDTIEAKNSEDTYLMLFFIDKNMSQTNYTLEAMFPPTSSAKVSLPFKNIKDNFISDSTIIPRDGNF